MLAMNDRLTGKLSRIRSGDYTPDDFIIADAKDAEMGGGNGALGVVAPDGKAMLPVTAGRYRQAMRGCGLCSSTSASLRWWLV